VAQPVMQSGESKPESLPLFLALPTAPRCGEIGEVSIEMKFLAAVTVVHRSLGG
jgi:hypothetical protein